MRFVYFTVSLGLWVTLLFYAVTSWGRVPVLRYFMNIMCMGTMIYVFFWKVLYRGSNKEEKKLKDYYDKF